MKQNSYRISASSRFQAVIHFLKELAWRPGDLLALSAYINTTCSPAFDATVVNRFKAVAQKSVLSLSGANVSNFAVQTWRPSHTEL